MQQWQYLQCDQPIANRVCQGDVRHNDAHTGHHHHHIEQSDHCDTHQATNENTNQSSTSLVSCCRSVDSTISSTVVLLHVHVALLSSVTTWFSVLPHTTINDGQLSSDLPQRFHLVNNIAGGPKVSFQLHPSPKTPKLIYLNKNPQVHLHLPPDYCANNVHCAESESSYSHHIRRLILRTAEPILRHTQRDCSMPLGPSRGRSTRMSSVLRFLAGPSGSGHLLSLLLWLSNSIHQSNPMHRIGDTQSIAFPNYQSKSEKKPSSSFLASHTDS